MSQFLMQQGSRIDIRLRRYQMAVLCGMATIQYSARSAWLMVAHSGHLNLEIQTAF